MKKTALELSLAAALSACSAVALADLAEIPAQAIPPQTPQTRPAPQEQATGISVENRLATPVATDNAATPAAAPTDSAVQEKTLNEISAMLVDIVQHGKNVAIIDQPLLPADAQPAVDSSRLSVPDAPHKHFRVFSEVAPQLLKGKADLNVQILRAGHRGDANDMLKPLAEKHFQIDPANVRAAEDEIRKFIFKNTDLQFDSQDAKGRPELSMWIEVSNENGTQGVDNKQNVKAGSKMIIYYRPNDNVYVNLFYVNSKGDIQRIMPASGADDNFARKNEVHRYPPTGEGITVNGQGADKIRAIYTRLPSGVNADVGTHGQLQSKQPPFAVIPTQYPAVFANPGLTRFFSLPEIFWNESEIQYTIVK
ncbi:MAG: DUF4384 domain-containing protein [Neisseria sp.]|nr:MAG: DUF4384 domain-containing protein [Neisseria sp.]